ncbi:MAG TPA: bifunctional 4-hydroxy-2-oxoglutarate aldolase/2-dehydro-3-deoxy-phosphogluconate aldolase [Solirubrobacteraceae bacterium]|jgi:2-dehydro-3-deoxyphosphogluconate aldolase/(4S)-4-hydroxy-2-oxoglutarate aldolase|nr:bifunctional 4-hydroxy-2-oxoglutarate aldolase/2-dehydro-3-deoxy-phosphogluconate aldolase [Solirubrobacteraceae bacterium]
MTGRTSHASEAARAAQAIKQARLIAIIRADTHAEILAAVRALAAAGAVIAEISLATADALPALEQATDELGDQLLLGAGTVRTPRDAERALAAGARFLVSPGLDHDVVSFAQRSSVLHLPGIFSPTELADALASGAVLVKLFPAGRLGPGYVRDLLAPFPEARLVPTGGITTANAGEFLDAGAVAVAVGTALVSPATVRDPEAVSAALMQFQSLITERTPKARPHGD